MSSPDPLWVKFDVSDTGVGLSEDVCAKILMPFSVLSSSREEVNGAGFGLYIVRLIVDTLVRN